MADDIYGPRPQATQVRNVRSWPIGDESCPRQTWSGYWGAPAIGERSRKRLVGERVEFLPAAGCHTVAQPVRPASPNPQRLRFGYRLRQLIKYLYECAAAACARACSPS